MRQVIATRMVESLQTSAQLTTVVEVDVTKIARLRDAGQGRLRGPRGRQADVPAVLRASPRSRRSRRTRSRQRLGRHRDARRSPTTTPSTSASPSTPSAGLLVPVIHNAGDLNLGRHRPQDRRPGRAHPRQQGQPGRARRRHVHADQHRQPRRAVRHPDHQPAAGRHPRHRRGGQARGRGRATPTSARRSRSARWSTWRCPTTTASSTAPTPPASSTTMKERLEEGAFEAELGL